MRREYEIKHEPVMTLSGQKEKWNIYYYINETQETKELYAIDYIENIITEIRNNYTLKQ
jgi:hypothetical protein